MTTKKNFVPLWQEVNAHSLTNMYRAMLVQLGVRGEDLQKPIIGIANSWSEVVPGHLNLRELAQAVKDGVRAAGGVPLEFNTIAVCDGMASANTGFRFILPARDLIADSLEVMAEAHHFDGIVAISACDKINPGMLMGAVRVDRPFLFVPGGIGCRLTPGHPLTADLGDASMTMCPADKLGTAITGQILGEALGVTQAGLATTFSNDFYHRQLAYDSGRRIVEMVLSGLNVRKIVNGKAIMNAAKISLAIGASMNVLLHLPAIAAEAGAVLPLSTFDRLSREIPYLTPLAPNGPCTVSQLERFGGISAVMKMLQPLLDLDAILWNGQTLGDFLECVTVDIQGAVENGILHTLENPISEDAGLGVLYGSLAPEGAVVRLAGIDPTMMTFEGSANVFDSEVEAWEALKGGCFKAGQVLVIRNEGLIGGPGMPEESNIAWRLQDLGMGKEVYFITDGRFSGGQAGQCIGMVSPEAARSGPISLVENGDRIRIDIPGRKLDLIVSEEVLAERKRVWTPPVPRYKRGILARYIRHVTSLDTGGAQVLTVEEGGDESK